MTSQQCHRGVNHGVDGSGARVREGTVEHGFAAVFFEFLTQRTEACGSLISVTECLDNFFVFYDFVDERCLFSAGLGLAFEHFVGMGSDETRDQETDRRQYDHQ